MKAEVNKVLQNEGRGEQGVTGMKERGEQGVTGMKDKVNKVLQE